jgi:hypothetical protein
MMDRKAVSEPPAGSPANPIPLSKSKKILEAYYAEKRLESPLGGQLDVLGVREGRTGVGEVLLECNTSSLRYILKIPKATKAEMAEVKKGLAAREDVFCPRHGFEQRLAKSGKSWVCSQCGVAYGKS